jgi:hypothetical protein
MLALSSDAARGLVTTGHGGGSSCDVAIDAVARSHGHPIARLVRHMINYPTGNIDLARRRLRPR